MLYKVVASKFCVVVWKPNGLDDIIYIGELDDEPQCKFQISKAEGIFFIMDINAIIPLSMLVGMNHLSNINIASCRLMLEVLYNPCIGEQLLLSV